MADWKEQLAQDLVSTGESNFGKETPEAMEAIANDIAKAIEDSGEGGGGGSSGGWKEAVEAESKERKEADSSLDSRITSLSESVDSNVNSLSRNINDESSRAKAAEKSNADAISSHTSSTSNPHSVTAEQVGAYTKEQVDGFIRNWSGYVVVPFGQSKPSASEAQLGKIYLVQVSNDPEVKDQYEEWISDGTAWSLIGTMSIDLSPYDKIVDAQAREKAINDALTAHKNDSVAHITAAERTKWNGKQDAIADLDAIRSGAALGATALQSFTETDPTVPSWAKQANKPTYTASEVGALTKTDADGYYQPKGSYATAEQGAKADTAVQPSSLAKVATSGSYNDLSNKPNSIGSADKLTTARTIAISGGATGTATSFNGTANISIPVTSMRENYMTWGGQDRTEPTPCDCGSIDEFGHNKLSFLPPDCLKVEYTNDGGETWLDYEASDNSKTKFVTTSGEGYILAKGSSEVDARPAQGGTLTNDNVANYMVRITVSSRRAGATNGSIYTRCVKLLINFSTNGATGCWVTAEKRSIGDYNNNADTWLPVFSKKLITGWSGWNSYPYSRMFGGFSTQTSQDADLRLTFGATGVSTSYSSRFSVIDLRMIGVTNWTMPSELARAGHLYQIISDKTAIFPKQLYVNDTKLVYAEDGKDVSIADGGTGASTAENALKNFTDGLSRASLDVTDTTDIITSADDQSGGFDGSSKKWYKRSAPALFNYIKSKLGSLATKSSVADADISGTISDTHIASASTWNGYATTIAGKQDALTFTTPAEITEILGGLE